MGIKYQGVVLDGAYFFNLYLPLLCFGMLHLQSPQIGLIKLLMRQVLSKLRLLLQVLGYCLGAFIGQLVFFTEWRNPTERGKIFFGLEGFGASTVEAIFTMTAYLWNFRNSACIYPDTINDHIFVAKLVWDFLCLLFLRQLLQNTKNSRKKLMFMIT